MDKVRDSVSYWIGTTQDHKRYPCFSAQEDSTSFDVAVVGGGIAGVLIAYELARSGRTVALLEKDALGCGASGRAMAKVTYAHGFDYHFFLAACGKEAASQYAESNRAGYERIRELITEHDIDCDFIENDNYSFVDTAEKVRFVSREYDALVACGAPVELAEGTSRPDVPFDFAAGVKLAEQGRFHPRKFVLAMADACEDLGVPIFEDTEVTAAEEATPCKLRVKTAEGEATVHATDVVFATGGVFEGISELDEVFSTWMGQVVAAPTKCLALADSYYEENAFPGSFRDQSTGDEHMILLGNAARDSKEPFAKQEEAAKELFDAGEAAYRWYGEDVMTPDLLPVIGRVSDKSEHLYMAAGFCAWGMTKGAVAATLINDLICTGHSPYEELYSASRPTLAKGLVFNVKKIAPDSGAIYMKGGEPVAVYRGAEGELHAMSPVCTHQGCQVAWVDAYKEWRCPCHGSRYDRFGKVVGGPAKRDLESRSLDDE